LKARRRRHSDVFPALLLWTLLRAFAGRIAGATLARLAPR
jgi:hypothetical protein